MGIEMAEAFREHGLDVHLFEMLPHTLQPSGAEAAGIELGPTGAIATDQYGRTNVDHVYAAGDVAESTHAVTGGPDRVPLALTANRAGRAIGATLAGEPTPVGEIVGRASRSASTPSPPRSTPN